MRPDTFEAFVGQFGTSSWSIFFIKASIDAVSDAYARLLGREIDHDVNVVLAKRHQYPPIGAVTQVVNSPWTIVFHLLGESEPFRDWETLERELNTDLLRFEANDTSGLFAMSPMIFEVTAQSVPWLALSPRTIPGPRRSDL